jgi:hypothetical protein
VDDRICEPPKEYVETHEGMPLELEHVLLTSMGSQGYLPLPSGRQTAGLLRLSQEGRGTYFHNYIFSQLFIPIFSYRFLVAYFHNHIFSQLFITIFSYCFWLFIVQILHVQGRLQSARLLEYPWMPC